MPAFAFSTAKSTARAACLGCALYAAVFAGAAGTLAVAGEDLVQQKLKMLENYLASPKIGALKSSGSEESQAHVRDGQKQLDTARDLLSQGNGDDAEVALDKGLRSVALAVRGAKDAQAAEREAHARYLSRRRQIDLYLDAIARAVSTAKLDSVAAQIAHIRGDLAAAEDLAGQSRYQDADRLIEQVHTQTVNIVTGVNAGKTLVSSLSFDTPQAEFNYELERNRSYEKLVTLAIDEGGSTDPSLRALADRLVAESRAMRQQAETESQNGAHQVAIETIEQATGRLLHVLRASGLPVFE